MDWDRIVDDRLRRRLAPLLAVIAALSDCRFVGRDFG
jgi:hypothetical protein